MPEGGGASLPAGFAMFAGGAWLTYHSLVGLHLIHAPSEGAQAGEGGEPGSNPASAASGAKASAPRKVGALVGAPGLKGNIQRKVYNDAQALGWSAEDWEWIIEHESGFDPSAVNPSSGAFGLGQALGDEGTAKHKMHSSNWETQLEGMAEYIAERYGNPTKARQFHEANNWY